MTHIHLVFDYQDVVEAWSTEELAEKACERLAEEFKGQLRAAGMGEVDGRHRFSAQAMPLDQRR